jgi:hypothetical protein
VAVHGGAGAPPAVHGGAQRCTAVQVQRARLKKQFGGLKKGARPLSRIFQIKDRFKKVCPFVRKHRVLIPEFFRRQQSTTTETP